MGRFWFIRHGESTANAEGWLAGHTDAPLTARGRAQAEALRPRLAACAPQRILSSDLCRAADTARLAWPDDLPPLEIRRGLRERTVGRWEGMPRRQLRSQRGYHQLLTWRGRPPNGESQRDLAVRVLHDLADADDGSDTLVFAHGGLIRVVVGLLDGTDVDSIGTWKVGNTEVAERVVEPGRWQRLLDDLP